MGSTAAVPGRSRTPGTRTPDPTNCPTVRVTGSAVEVTPAPPLGPTSPQVPGYEILSIIGSGGMGIVFKARHRDLNRTVAIKLLRGAALDDDEFRDRFQAEAEAVARLQHPNIIQVFEIGTATRSADGRLPGPFISLEYVDGGSLARLTSRPQPPREAARIVAKLAEATAAAHDAGVVHRDLKPANILMTADGEPKIADFGLAKQLGSERDLSGRFVTQAGTVVGTPEYMAPEQAAGAAPTTAVDVYALGVILYELMTGRVPFQAATPIDTMTLVRTQEPVFPRRLQPGVPRDLDTICTKCLERDPARRYPSARALADDLQRFLAGQAIRARQVTDTERVVRWCRRNPVVSGSLAGVAATFLAAFLLVSRSYWRAEAARQDEVRQRELAEERERAERWERYQANVLAAASALQVDNVTGARRELERAPTEHRAWEWRHFNSRLDAASQVIGTGADSSPGTDLYDDGRRLVVCREGHRVDVWDPIAGRRLGGLADPSAVGDPMPAPDGRVFATTHPDHTVRLRDVEAGRDVCALTGHTGPVTSVKFFAGGARVLTRADDQTVRVWDAATGAQLRSIGKPLGAMQVASLSPDGRRLLVGPTVRPDVPPVVELWDLETWTRIARLPTGSRHVLGSNFSPDGRLVFTIGDLGDYTVDFWDAATGALVTSVKRHTNRMSTIAFSPDGERVATGSLDQTICLTELRTGRTIDVLKGHRGWVWSVRFSPDGGRLVSASQDRTVRLWDGRTGNAIETLHGHTGDVWTAGYTADGGTIVSAGDATIRHWDARRAEDNGVLKGHKSYVYGVAVHPDGELVASAAWDGTARVWEATTGRQLFELNHGPADQIAVAAVDFHPGGRLLATRSRDTHRRGRDTVRLWDVTTGREVDRWPVESDVWRDTRLAFSPDGRLLATGFYWNQVAVWDVSTKERVALLGPTGDAVRDLTFSPDGRLLAVASEDKKVRVWNAGDWSVVKVLEGHTKEAYAVVFSPDGRRLATGSVDGTARLWDTGTWDELAVLKHPCKVYGLAFTPDGTRLATGCLDNSVRLWDLANYREVAELRGHTAYIHSVAFTPDGTRLVSGSGDFTVRVWDTLSRQDRAARGP